MANQSELIQLNYLIPAPKLPITGLSARQINILRSPKNNGSALADSANYLKALDIEILDSKQSIQFLPNSSEPIHRWSPYVQGFSAKFVQRVFDKYKNDYVMPVILDPFAGSGTVNVQSKLNGYPSYGVELNPLLHFIAQTKINSWSVKPEKLLAIAQHLSRKKLFDAPSFLKSSQQFNPKVLANLEKLKGGIDSFEPQSMSEGHIKDLMLLAFASILIECSNLKRTPCLGYSKNKHVEDNAPFHLFAQKIDTIAFDLGYVQNELSQFKKTKTEIELSNSIMYEHPVDYDLVITSPPYMNGLDYVINYKIEMGWLGYAENHKQLKQVKDEMVVCDNVSKGLINDFAHTNHHYTNNWLIEIKQSIADNILKRGKYRRIDMPHIVHKYFDDMHKVMLRVAKSLKPKGRFILVVGDSLIADVYVPTDLILAYMGKELGLELESIEKARKRRSGQVRSYELRETIVTLRKG